jgi:hypothetical protein
MISIDLRRFHIKCPGGEAAEGRARPPSRHWPAVAATLMAVAHVGLLLHGMGRNFVTSDEGTNLLAGVSYRETGRFDESRVNPPLVKVLAAAPVFLADPGIDRLALGRLVSDDLYAFRKVHALRLM